MSGLDYRDFMTLPGVGPLGNGNRPAPTPGSPEAEREKRALEAWKRQLEQRLELIEARLLNIERVGRDDAGSLVAD